MSDASEEVRVHDLRPAGHCPEGFLSTEINVSSDEVREALTTISGISAIVANSFGIDKAIKDLMLGLEASAIAMMQFTSGGQVLNILDNVRQRVVEFDGFLEKAKAAEAAADATKH